MPSPASTNSTAEKHSRVKPKKKTGTSRVKIHRNNPKSNDKTGQSSQHPKIATLIKATIDEHCVPNLDTTRNQFRSMIGKILTFKGKILESEKHLAKYGTKMSIKYKEGDQQKEKHVYHIPAPYRFNQVHIQMIEDIREEEDMKKAKMDAIKAQDQYKLVLTELKKKTSERELGFRKEKMLSVFIDELQVIFTTVIEASKGDADLQ